MIDRYLRPVERALFVFFDTFATVNDKTNFYQPIQTLNYEKSNENFGVGLVVLTIDLDWNYIYFSFNVWHKL